MQNDVKKQRLVLGLGAVIVFVWVLIEVNKPKPHYWPDTLPTHTVRETNLELVWSLSDIFTAKNIKASNGVIIFIGGMDIDESGYIHALDVSTGEQLWQSVAAPKWGDVFVIDNTLYYGGMEMVARELKTGGYLWHTGFPDLEKIVGQVVLYDTELHVSGYARSYVLTLDGELLETTKDFSKVFPREIQMMEQLSRYDSFEYFNFHEHNDLLIGLTGHTDDWYRMVYAFDSSTFTPVWQTERNIISNIAVTDENVCFLTNEGQLVVLDLKTGKKTGVVDFGPNPFVHRGFELGIDDDYSNRHYSVTVDPDNHIVLAYLGDSNQLFAFHLP